MTVTDEDFAALQDRVSSLEVNQIGAATQRDR